MKLPNLSNSTGMLIDGIFASEAIDSSGEILDVKGADITDFEDGKGVLNFEHRGDDAPGASANDIVVVSGPLPVDEINKCLRIDGYCQHLLRRLGTMPHGKRMAH